MKGMVTNMWAYESVFYQIYPMGFCGVPFENDGVQRHEIKRVEDWIPHMQKLGVNAVYFSPVFESDTHGYNTRDYRKIDVRLGTNEDFKEVCDALHRAGIRVVLDGEHAAQYDGKQDADEIERHHDERAILDRKSVV